MPDDPAFAAALLAVPLSWWAHASLASAEDGRAVVASIKAVHSLVSAVMAGVGEPQLLIRGSSSPHAFSLRPSDAAVLEDASVIFWIGDSMESSLAGPISTLGREARLVTLSEAPDLVRRPFREGGAFEGHAHRDGDQGGRDHGRHDEDHDEHHNEDHDNETVGRDGVAFDMHIWLDPHDAGVMARTTADMLSEVDPANADRYASNAETLVGRLEVLRADIDALVAPARSQPFIIFHDAYRYFEDRFGLAAVGSVVVSPERTPGVRRILDLRDKVRELGVVCVFSEPQFQPRLVTTIIEDIPARAGVVDPLGASIETEPELYFTLLRDIAESFAERLTPAQDGSGQ